jgi:hypothetical protein
MTRWRSLLVLAIPLASLSAADPPVTVTASSSNPIAAVSDTVIVTLPGAPAAPKPPEPASVEEPPAPKPELPEAFKTDSSVYLQRVIGIWKRRDAEALLGPPARNRAVYDEKKRVNGQIFAWSDPTGRYRELELDFEADSGSLRTVFAYPNAMTWDDCRKLWGANVNTTHAKNGRNFYSYLNRKLDVLVDGGGKVISLGLY